MTPGSDFYLQQRKEERKFTKLKDGRSKKTMDGSKRALLAREPTWLMNMRIFITNVTNNEDVT